jgi:hypothetical protein
MARIYTVLASAVLFFSCQIASAQICRPVAERTGEVGCWIITQQSVGQLTKPETFWYWMLMRPWLRLKQRKLLVVPSSNLLERFGSSQLQTRDGGRLEANVLPRSARFR